MIIQIQPWINYKENIELFKVIRSTFITEGNKTSEFEELTKKLTGSKHAVAYANGTVALYAALKTLNIGYGDEVIVPNLTFIATANAVIMAGAKPVFCDIDKDDLGISPEKIEKLISKKTKVIIPVHLYGNSCKIDKIIEIAKNHNLKVIEDAAQGVGVHYKGQHVGTFGDIGVLSYYGNKTITTAEGGMILTNIDDYKKSCYRLKNHGRDKKGVFKHDHIGFNFAFTDLQAAVGISQMKKLQKIIIKKRRIFEKYKSSFDKINQVEIFEIKNQKNPVYWFSSIYTKHKIDLQSHLKKNKIQTRDFFYPLNLQPCYKGLGLNTDDDFSNSIDIYNNSLSLPSSYILKNKEQNLTISSVKDFFTTF